MKNKSLETTVRGYEPFDLLRLSKDDFYNIVNQDFPNLEIIDMSLSFKKVDKEVVIKAKIIDFKKY